jgi:hypothetical protein
MTEPIPADIRSKVEALVAKAQADDTFAFRLREEPEAVLTAEGFTGDALSTLTRELSDEGVEGFVRCDRISCIFTSCTYWTGWD